MKILKTFYDFKRKVEKRPLKVLNNNGDISKDLMGK